MMLWWLTWLACSRSTPFPSERLLVVHETPDAVHHVAVLSPTTGALTSIAMPQGNAFAGPPDPQGTDALVIRTGGPRDAIVAHMILAPFDGGPPVPLAGPASQLRAPWWAPDGSWLVYESDEASFRDIYRVDRTGGPPKRLTRADHGSFEPSVSPDGERIAFASSRDEDAEIYVMTAQGGLQTRLTRSLGDDMRPRWSAAGTLGFLTRREGPMRVWTMNADGSSPVALLPDAEGEHTDFAWQPGGSLMVVTQLVQRTVSLLVVDTATHKVVATFGGDSADDHPAWSPDGSHLAWTSLRDGNAAVYAARPDGTEVRRVSQGTDHVWLPRWVPDAGK